MNSRLFLERKCNGWMIIEHREYDAFPYEHGWFPTLDQAIDGATMRWGGRFALALANPIPLVTVPARAPLTVEITP